MRYEHKSEPLLDRREFLVRFLKHIGVSSVLVVASLVVGTVGFVVFARFSWIDSFLNASMLLGGMGPVGDFHGDHGKMFASLYALYAGLVFLIVASVLFAPVFHRVLHKFHVDK